jgi:hypothetical protein
MLKRTTVMKLKSLYLALLLLTTLIGNAAIISISAEENSQDTGNNDSYPARDNLWLIKVPPYPFDTKRGIGRIIHESAEDLKTDIGPNRLGVLHSHKYQAAHIPLTTATVTYTFDVPTGVAEVELLQHENGVIRIEGFAGNDLDSMVSLGNVYGSRGNIKGRSLFSEGETNVFRFDNKVSGRIFQFRITETSLADGYALHRAFPRDEHGNRIAPAMAPLTNIRVSEIEISWQSIQGARYRVEYRNEAAADAWIIFIDAISGNGEVMTIHDKVEANNGKKLYRVLPILD